MKSNRVRPIWPIVLSIALLVATAASGWAEDWKTIDGKVYQDITVLQVEPDAVTILHKDGGALVPLELLPPEIQKRFNYDPKKAKVAADARMAQEIADARALRLEKAQYTDERVTEDGEAADNSDLSAANSSVPSPATATSSPGAHHTMDELTGSVQSLQRDLSDPTYHTMAHLALTVHSLLANPTDPTHHTISEIANPSP